MSLVFKTTVSLHVVKSVHQHQFLALEWLHLLCPGFYFMIRDYDNLEPLHTVFIHMPSTKYKVVVELIEAV